MKPKHILLSAGLSLSLFCACTDQQEPQVEQPEPVQVQALKQPTYQLFPTQNMWVFLKLNTVNGKIWMVQYSVNEDTSRMQAELNSQTLLTQKQEPVQGRFTLVPTSNMWNFILLDQIDGRQWQVQWSLDAENNFVVTIQGSRPADEI